jgi:hypothetical protein
MSAAVLDGQLVFFWEYAEGVHRRATIEALAGDVIEALRVLARP